MGKVNLENYTEKLKTLFAKYPNVVCVFVFGSYNTPFYNENSDIDFGIVYDKPAELFEELEIEDRLSQLLGTDNIDVVNLNTSHLVLKYNAVSKGMIIYESNYIKTSDFLENVYKFYCDFEYDYRMLCADYDQSLKETYTKYTLK